MTMRDVQALRKELLELDADLRRFKSEILAARIKQFEQTIHSAERPRPSKPAVLAHSR
ncbi:MAG: hypothetical protein ACYTDV_14355 [Planctomycetota bacterium]|jgi:hypothetical protein